ncbi:hypothetical protein B0H14DRAFT_696663 [Mycena olivaceomarginata]|nr:hypothetical protein B0H14DRAFT_696663 [Mycena olivaceomarginata]
MQTRRQAREAAELAAAVQAIVQPVNNVAPSPPAHNNSTSLVWAPSFASSLSDLTPTSSFVSDAGTVRADSLDTVEETDDESNDGGYASTIAAAAGAFGVPQTNTGKRSLRTPMQSQVYPQEVLETPRKNWRPRPTEEEQRAAQLSRDSEIARSGGRAQLTQTGTLLVFPEPSPDPDQERTGAGLGSAFTSPSSAGVVRRTTAPSSRVAPYGVSPLKKRALQEAKTERMI